MKVEKLPRRWTRRTKDPRNGTLFWNFYHGSTLIFSLCFIVCVSIAESGFRNASHRVSPTYLSVLVRWTDPKQRYPSIHSGFGPMISIHSCGAHWAESGLLRPKCACVVFCRKSGTESNASCALHEVEKKAAMTSSFFIFSCERK